MGVVVTLDSPSNESFTQRFRCLHSSANDRKDYRNLLQLVINYYINPENPKEHQLFAFLSVIYESCPESFFDYVKDFDAIERDFIITAKIMFEEEDIDRLQIKKWKTDILGSSILSTGHKDKTVVKITPEVISCCTNK